MSTKSGRIDLAYIKDGDVIADMERIKSSSEVELQCGPDAFLYDLLDLTRQKDVLLMATSSSTQYMRYRETVVARTIKSGKSVLGRIFSKPFVFAAVLCHLMRYRPPRVLCGANREPFWASYVYAQLSRTPLVHSRHNRVSGGNGSLYQRVAVSLDNYCIRRVAGVVCHGPYLRDELLGIGLSPSKVHEFDVDFVEYRERARKAGSQARSVYDGKKIVLYSGRVEPLKGVFDLFHALRDRLKRDADTILVYAGHGSASSDLFSKVADAGLDKNIQLLGRIPHSELSLLIARCKVVVTPTRTRFAEGRCMVAMESLVLGVPVVAPGFGPFPYLVKDRVNGLLFQPDSVSDLREKLNAILDDSTLYKQLQHGAELSGDSILNPPLKFGAAVSRAFGVRQ